MAKNASNKFIEVAAKVNKDFKIDENNPIIQNIAEAGTDLIQELGAEEIPKEQRSTWDDVRNSAIQVLLTAQAIKKNEELRADHIRKSIKSLSEKGNQEQLNQLSVEVKNLQSNDLQNSARYRELMVTVLDLQNKVNSILGQKIKLIFAYAEKDGTVTLYEHDRNTIDYWGAGGKILSSKFKKIDLETKTSRILENQNLNNLNATYKEIYTRANYAKARVTKSNNKIKEQMKKVGKTNKEIKKNLDFSFYLLWRNGGKWMRYRVGTQGIILEAYFNFFIHKDNAFQLVEPAVGRYILVGMAAVDNTSGFLEGDVSIGSTQYAVKGLNASAIAYYEIVTQYATEIVTITDEASGIEYLEKLKKDLHSSSPLLKQTSAKQITETVNGLLTKTGNEAWKDYSGSWTDLLNKNK